VHTITVEIIKFVFIFKNDSFRQRCDVKPYAACNVLTLEEYYGGGTTGWAEWLNMMCSYGLDLSEYVLIPFDDMEKMSETLETMGKLSHPHYRMGDASRWFVFLNCRQRPDVEIKKEVFWKMLYNSRHLDCALFLSMPIDCLKSRITSSIDYVVCKKLPSKFWMHKKNTTSSSSGTSSETDMKVFYTREESGATSHPAHNELNRSASCYHKSCGAILMKRCGWKMYPWPQPPVQSFSSLWFDRLHVSMKEWTRVITNDYEYHVFYCTVKYSLTVKTNYRHTFVRYWM
jgi:hypothetical protein